MNKEKMAHDLALSFAVSQQAVDKEEPQKQLEKLLEDYCAAYGFISSKPDGYITELIRRGE